MKLTSSHYSTRLTFSLSTGIPGFFLPIPVSILACIDLRLSVVFLYLSGCLAVVDTFTSRKDLADELLGMKSICDTCFCKAHHSISRFNINSFLLLSYYYSAFPLFYSVLAFCMIRSPMNEPPLHTLNAIQHLSGILKTRGPTL